MKKATKTVVINLLSGKQVRIKKNEVVEVQEQMTLLGGGIDVVVFMKSGWQYIVNESKKQIQNKITN